MNRDIVLGHYCWDVFLGRYSLSGVSPLNVTELMPWMVGIEMEQSFHGENTPRALA